MHSYSVKKVVIEDDDDDKSSNDKEDGTILKQPQNMRREL